MLFSIVKIAAIMAILLLVNTFIFIVCILISSLLEDKIKFEYLSYITIVVSFILCLIASIYITLSLVG